MIEHLPAGFCARPANTNDIEAVTELYRAVDIDLTGESDVSLEDTRSDWATESFNLDTDTCVIESSSRNEKDSAPIVGYAEVWNRGEHAYLAGDGYVHPAYVGLGIGTALLHWVETRARQHIPLAPPEKRVFIRSGAYGHDTAAINLFVQAGYAPVRYFWRMQIDLTGPPPAAVLPGQLTMRDIHPSQEDERLFYETLQEAFQDHWGYSRWDYSDWRTHHMHPANFDRSLWHIIEDDGQPAAALIARYRSDRGWVSSLGVRKPWRQRGLGLALLYQSFLDFYQRGTTSIALNVDASSLTGATRLYERAGMRVVEKLVAYEKELRPGEDIME